mmetsp:Transcript_27375/g.81758  ORF Transcript_27375/g.81758 Transcript_27375/m.81758 type:complete len:250 (-) Transcript_27375:442-1191(-)
MTRRCTHAGRLGASVDSIHRAAAGRARARTRPCCCSMGTRVQGSTAKPGERRESRIITNTGAHAVASRISDGRAGEARSLARVCVVRGAWQHRVSPLRPSRPALGPASPRHGAAKERTISLTSAAYLRWMLCLPSGKTCSRASAMLSANQRGCSERQIGSFSPCRTRAGHSTARACAMHTSPPFAMMPSHASVAADHIGCRSSPYTGRCVSRMRLDQPPMSRIASKASASSAPMYALPPKMTSRRTAAR